MVKLKDMENLIKLMGIYMKENGKMINKKEKGKKYGPMVQFMKGNFIKELKMEKENLLGERGVVLMKVNFLIIKYLEKEYSFLVIKESMKVVGKIIKWMDLESLNGLMEENMKENIKMIKKKDMVFIVGLMEEYIKEIGKMEDKMEKENFMM